MNGQRLVPPFIAFGASCALAVALAASLVSAANVTSAEMEKAVEAARVLPPEYRTSVTRRQEEAVVSSYRNPKATDADCKIDAVLIARTIMETTADEVKRVRVRLYSLVDKQVYDEVTVGAGDVKAFSSGQLKSDDLIASLELVRAKSAESSSPSGTVGSASGGGQTVSGEPADDVTLTVAVAKGPLAAERAVLLSRIKCLENAGVGVKPFMDEFKRLENVVASQSAAAIATHLDSLSRQVGDQEKALDARAKTSGGSTARRSVPRPTSVVSTREGTETLERINEQWDEHLTTKYGPFIPARKGPMRMERWVIAKRLVALKRQGYDISRYEQPFKEMEYLASRNQIDSLKAKVKTMALYLGIQDPTDNPDVQRLNRAHSSSQRR